MHRKGTCIAVAIAAGIVVCVAAALAPCMVAAVLRVSLHTQGGVVKYSINERDFGTNQTRAVAILAKVSRLSSDPFRIVVDSNTTFVAFASFLEQLNQACPGARWFATYRADAQDVKVLYDVKVVSEPHVEWVITESEEPLVREKRTGGDDQ